jgi:hypothetical protein
MLFVSHPPEVVTNQSLQFFCRHWHAENVIWEVALRERAARGLGFPTRTHQRKQGL